MTATVTPATAPKKAVNRKLAYLALAGIGVIGVIALVTVQSSDPRTAQAEKRAEAERAALEQLPAGTEAAGRQQVELAQAEAEKKRKDEERAAKADGFDAAMGAAPKGGRSTGYPPLDPELLRQLDEAQREVGSSPSLGRAARTTGQQGGSSGLLGDADGGAASQSGIVYDNYSTTAKTLVSAEHDALFDEDAERAEPAGEVYEVIRPNVPPKGGGIINQGAAIQAVLMTRIDTRNAGPITAMVSRTVYDSRTQRIPLIPQGARLVGTYDANVKAGVDRVPVQFSRLIFPDGRAVALPSFPASGGDGTIGVDGKYKSNILRAIGPAFLVALMGQAVDRQINNEIPSASAATPGMGGVYQSPSVMQQVAPKLNEAVMQRYAGATPYFIANPGQAIRVVVTADVAIPGARR